MKQIALVYKAVTFIEVALLVLMSALSVLWLYQEKTILFASYLSFLIRAALAISIIIVLESAAIVFMQKQWRQQGKTGGELNFPEGELLLCLLVFLLLWFLHGSIFNSIAISKLGLTQGTDEYMLWLRPGSSIIFLSVVGTGIVHTTMRYLNKLFRN